jgi:4-hydroxy-3-polyprenylbenzoate decarboxylase
LKRVDWRTDLHFQTCTTIDTLDYSGTGLNAGSKVVVAAAGPVRRELSNELPSNFHLPPGFSEPRVCLPGIVAIQSPSAKSCTNRHEITRESRRFVDELSVQHPINEFPLIVLVDDSKFVAESLSNFLWVVFTRSDPASDIYGIGESIKLKHWGCEGALVIDARIKPHHAPPLEEDPEVTRRVDALAARGRALHGII